jgi:DNA-binding CsgD family transcriptional regulator
MRVIRVSYLLVDRAQEQRQLRQATRRVAAGLGGAVLLEGEPGIGKTALLDVVAADAAGLGVRVLRGAGTQLERRLAFAAVMSAFPSESPAIRRAGESTVLAGAADQEYVVAEAVLDRLDQWCARGPVALVLDDVQWADPSSRLVLGRLGSALGQLPLLLVLAYQPTPGDTELDGLLRRLRARGAVPLPLGPLDEDSVGRLVRQLVGEVPEPGLLDRAAGAAGNPLYVTELVRTGDGTSLSAAVTRRLEALPAPARELLGVAAVLGGGFTLTELSTVLGTPVIELWQATSEAVRAGLLTESGDRLVFRHELIREALAQNTPAAVRDALLAQAGYALARAGAAVERVAELFAAGGSLDRRTVAWLSGAADQLIVRAPALAVDLLERAVDDAPLTAPETAASGPPLPADDQVALRLRLARALIWAQRPRDAERTVEAALASLPPQADPARVADLRWMLAQACFQRGHLERALAEARRALPATDPPTAAAARLHGFLAQCRLLLGQPEAAYDSAAASLAAAQASGDAYGTAFGLYIEAGVRLVERRPAEGMVLADRALAALGAREIPPDLPLAPYLVRGFCLLELDRAAEADEAFELGLRRGARGGHAFLTWYQMGRAWLRYLDGRWDDALAEIDAALEMVDPFGMAGSLRALATVIALHRGTGPVDPDLFAGPDTSLAGRYWPFLRLTVRALTADPERGYAELLAATGAGLVPPPLTLDGIYPDLARLALATGRTGTLAPLAGALDRLADGYAGESVPAAAALVRGVHDRDPQRLSQAADGYARVGRPLFTGYAYECAGLVLRDGGRAPEARSALNAALDRYESLDAGTDTARAEASLREVGGRRRRTRPRPRTGWAALTVTERKVARFVAEGRSNPDIAEQMYLSRRTVQSHVSSILAKLGLASRVELAVSEYARQAGE